MAQKTLAAAERLVSFINKSPSPFHAVENCRQILAGKGFTELNESDEWTIEPNGKYFMTRNQSTLIAFAVGGSYKPGNGFSMVGAHTDSPCLRVKPVSAKENAGYVQVGVELYGGGSWLTWFDRDLKAAGRAIVKNGERLESRLVCIDRPILRVPHLAIHLNRDLNAKFSPNKEDEIIPVLATSAFAKDLNAPYKAEASADDPTGVSKNHSGLLMAALSEELKVPAQDIIDFELYLADCQDGVIGGILKEFIFAPRIDNLFNAYTCVEALAESTDNLASDSTVRVASIFDHEEIGSSSAQGAASDLQALVLKRLCAGGGPTAYERAISKSLLVSADQAHAVHPNYSSKHEGNHKIQMHKGIVLKINSNQRYASNAETISILRVIAKTAGVPLQEFVVRNDSPCGSTIGPIMASNLGMRTVDIGGTTLSMHSIREMCDTTSVVHALDLYKEFYRKYDEVRANCNF